MTPQKLRERRQMREHRAVYQRCLLQHQQQVRDAMEQQVRHDAVMNAINQATAIAIEQLNAPLYELMADIQMSERTRRFG